MSGRTARSDRSLHWAIAAILVTAVALRAAWFPFNGVHHADEAIQYLEQANRLLTGQGLIPWEYRVGMRSWLLPVLLAGPMWIGERLGDDPFVPIAAARIAAAIAALAPLWAAYALGARLSRAHGLIALLVMAVWYESVFFSVHTLSETLATACILPAAALLYGPRTPRRMMLAGVLLALGGLLRFHYGPAIALLALFALGRDWVAWRWAVLGGLVAAAVSVTMDLGMGQVPFGWVVQNVFHNVVLDRASDFGRLGPFGYPRMLLEQWGPLLFIIPVLAWIGARRYPLLLAVAVANIAVHILIGHKEYRFIWLSVSLILLLAAIGSVDVADSLRRRWPSAWSRRTMVAVVAALWGTGSAAMATMAGPDRLTQNYFPEVFAFARSTATDRACGVAVHGDPYWMIGGYAWLRPGGTALYFLPNLPAGEDAAGVRALAPAVDAFIRSGPQRPMPAEFKRVGCGESSGEHYCFYRREGTCRPGGPAARWDAQRVLERYGL